MRDAIYKQTDQYKEFENILKKISHSDGIFSMVEEFFKNNPDSEKISGQLLKRIEPILEADDI